MYKVGINVDRVWPDATNPDFVSDPAPAQPRQLGMTYNGNIYMFANANGALEEGEVVVINAIGRAQKLTKALVDARSGFTIAVTVNTMKDKEDSWFAIVANNVNVRVGANCAANAALYTTSTSGRLDDAVSNSQTIINGITLTAARENSVGAAPAVVYFPKADIRL